MFWLTWRQFRAQAIIAGSALAIAAIGLIISGISLRHSYNDLGLPACQAHHDCAQLATAFFAQLQSASSYGFVSHLSQGLLFIVPGLIGLFWGAPLLAREFETGTVRVAWNQSVTRRRWLAVKLGVAGLAAIVTAGVLSLLVTWWSGPIDRAASLQGQGADSSGLGAYRIEPSVFGVRDIVPVGYAIFALALGAVLGVLIRRAVPAMAATVVVFAAVQVVWPNWIRSHLISPVTVRSPVTGNLNELAVQMPSHEMTVMGSWSRANVWLLSNVTVTPSGKPFTGPATSACIGNSPQACTAWVLRQHLVQLVSYQPASRFWAFQWLETGIFVAIAVVLAAFCAWWLNRRRLA
ncbi:MAG TPA: ABC transporter permease subunit [Streptosporangiaceae bacterium]|nr:ABC transporter permease subunit [Streptosporangiaceae bacterium]